MPSAPHDCQADEEGAWVSGFVCFCSAGGAWLALGKRYVNDSAPLQVLFSFSLILPHPVFKTCTRLQKLWKMFCFVLFFDSFSN